MRILVTGATGFLGSYLVTDLLTRGHAVAVLLRRGSNHWRLADVLDRLTIVEGSLEDVAALPPLLERFAPQAIAHMAWTGVGNADRNSPAQARNIPQTVDLAALAADLGAEAFVGAGSQAEYGPYSRPIREDDATRPTTLYGSAKLAAGLMAGQLCAERGVRFAWLRIFSTYGPKDAETWLIPSMIRALSRGERISLTNCEQRWSFLHARDAAAAFSLALTHTEARGLFNLGSPDAPLLRETVIRLRDLVNPSAELGFGDVSYRPDQVMVLKPDLGRLEALGWRAQVPLEDGLRETVEWYGAVEHA